MTSIQLAHNVLGFTQGVFVEEQAVQQLARTASLPILAGHLAVMPDVHYGIGSTVGSVIPTKAAVIPAAVGVDIGCGMIAVKTNLTASDLPDSLKELRHAIERSVPVGMNAHKAPVSTYSDGLMGLSLYKRMQDIRERFLKLRVLEKLGKLKIETVWNQVGTLGGGNHFIEVCLDKEDNVWVMLHSGSRGIGNQMARVAIDEAKALAREKETALPDRDLAWLDEGTPEFEEYMESLQWAQDYAALNRDVMLHLVLKDMKRQFPSFELREQAINCHHNYTSLETHQGVEMWITRKGAVNAAKDVLGIIPGSMGAKSFIVRGKGNAESYCSCSHGAGRMMSRTEASKRFTSKDLADQTYGIECRKDSGVVDEIPSAYKDIHTVMAAQSELVDIVAELRQVLCVKG